MTSISKKLERVQLKGTQIKLDIPKKVLDQIKWLCKEIPKVEWSGVLFYSIEGSIKDPKNMLITLQEILPMHKGSGTYTEYSFDERVLNFMMDTEGADDWKMGHIHSHNTMAVYFSGTDWSELEDNAPNHNFYLSLIVNNFMDFCAKVCFIAETESANFTAKDENGQRYVYAEDEEVEERKLIVYDCDINSPETFITVEEVFADKVSGIIASAAARPKAPAKSLYTPVAGKPQRNPGIDAWAFPGKGQSLVQAAEEMEEQKDEVVEEFTRFVLNTGNDISSLHTVEDCLEFYKPYQISGTMLSANILEKYAAIYDKYFDLHTDKDSPKMFSEILEGVTSELETEIHMTKNTYIINMLNPVIAVLKNLLTNFKKHEPEHNG